MRTSDGIAFIDLVCGIGGIRLGMESAGFHCVFSCDINEDCQKNYFENFGEVPDGDIKAVDEKSLPGQQVLC
ncbi:MAG: DNA cytosine methyltransferase, partial [Treponemataceae bacterium]|nr:DNA cytosine methyltransferase [Treponemataceae bacterium]